MLRHIEHFRKRRKSARDHCVKRPRRAVVFGARALDRDIAQAQLIDGLRDKTGLFGIAVEQHQLKIRAGQRQRYAGNARTGTDIDHTPPVQIRNNRQRIEHMVRDHFFRHAHGGEVVGGVPFFQQVQEREQWVA